MKERKIAFAIISLVFISLFIAGCFALPAHEEIIVDDYGLFAADTIEQTVLCKFEEKSFRTVVDSMIFSVGWNDEYIIAKRHPYTDKYGMEIDRKVIEYYIVELDSESVFGPFVLEEYRAKKKELGIDPNLGFSKKIGQ